MDRLSQLIGKLKEQSEQNADHAQLLITTQMIESELRLLIALPGRPAAASKISVVMPAARAFRREEVIATTAEVVEQEEIIDEPPVKKNGSRHTSDKPETNGYQFDPLVEIPTLSHQHTPKELNEMMAAPDFSLNDKLKEQVLEIGHILTDAPIKDLKKGIGINDRFVFINELFRGDEVMYERSLKTINSFRILAEAEYWIERELKVKLGWDDTKETTRHFYQLVRRRFL
ncbi:MAG: hypothetical protein EOO02_16060 [Chitinophagaceae bacterium]|nr:MAG: hypothetical protein EOO02_16060 [Chitinophagaceae bacterium]